MQINLILQDQDTTENISTVKVFWLLYAIVYYPTFNSL
jgi:hypothetical protein